MGVIRSIFLSICLLLVFQNGPRVVLVNAQYTNYYDVLGLSTLALLYPQLDEPVDDPCYPVKVTWIQCSSSYPYRVTALNLGNKKLTGELPDFSFMDALEIIDLHDNSLTGPIPTFFSYFAYLRKLDLSNNRFTGPIPSSLANNKNLVSDFSGNPGLNSGNTSPPGSNTSPPYGSGTNNPSYNYTPYKGKKKSSKLPIILGVVGGLSLISSIAGAIAVRRQRQRTAAAVRDAAAGNRNAAQINPTNVNGTPVEKGQINNQNGANNA